MATQRQHRRGTAAQVAAFTPAISEYVFDTTNNRIYAGDGSTLGGHAIPNAQDAQKQTFVRGTVGGTADAITLTFTPARAAYATGEKVSWIQSGNNTAAVTINRDALGAKPLKKNVTDALAADDLKSGGYYEAVYDGTNYQLTNAAAGGTGEVFLASVAVASPQASMILPVTSGYDEYVLSCWMRPATDGAVPSIEFSVDGGANYLASNYFGSVTELAGGAATFYAIGATNGRLLPGGTNQTEVGNDAGDGVGFTLNLPALAGTQRKRFHGHISWTGAEATGGNYGGTVHGGNTTQSAVTHIRLKFSIGNIAEGWASLNAKRRT